MSKFKGLITFAIVAIVFVLMGSPVQAQNGSVGYGGIEFPLGNKSFADKVLNFNPGKDTGEKDGAAAIGPPELPDVGKDTGPSIIGHKGDVSLGKGGSITLKFTDNYLIDVKGLDLYVFEAGRDVEPFNVEISKDGSSWIDLGTVSGQPTGLDIQGKVAPGDKFSYVRLSDPNPYVPQDPNKIGQTLYWGADIDAVGAIGAEEKHDSDGDGISDDHDKCTGTPAGTEVDEYGCQVGALPDVTEPPPSTTGSCDWTGTWDTSQGKMELVQTGNAEAGADVAGTASLLLSQKRNKTGSSKPEKGNIQSIVLGNKLSGSWLKSPTYGPPEDAGDILFIISEDCNSFNGTWRYGYGTDKWDGDWTGSRTGSSKTSSKDPLKQTACASARPSFTEGSVFKPARFVIGGTKPQQITITQRAENFSIKKEDGGVVYQVNKGKSWGSLGLDPGTYTLSCNGGGAMGLMSASVCVEYPDATAAPPPPAPETKVGVSLPPREVVLATMPDGSKLVGSLPAIGPDFYSGNYLSHLVLGVNPVVEVGKKKCIGLHSVDKNGRHIEPSYWMMVDPGYLARLTRAGTSPDGTRGITCITGTKAGKGWLISTGKGTAPLVVVSATPPPPTKGGEMTIEGKVTYRGNPVPKARISFNHESGKSFQSPDWETKADGSFRIMTKKLWVGEYRVRVFKQGTSFGKTMWSKKEPKIIVLADKSVSFGPYDIKMETMREKYPGFNIPGDF